VLGFGTRTLAQCVTGCDVITLMTIAWVQPTNGLELCPDACVEPVATYLAKQGEKCAADGRTFMLRHWSGCTSLCNPPVFEMQNVAACAKPASEFMVRINRGVCQKPPTGV
jgi:hypothetical protein